MFEGHINKASFGESRESEVLRQFCWTDLVARLAATRDLRDELAGRGDGDFLAFGTARRTLDESKDTVNHSGLAHFKAPRLFLDPAANDAVHGDREKK